MTIEELIRAAAAAMKMPESMVRQSAEVRANAAGRPIEEILGEWAGVDPSAEAPPEAAEAAPGEPPLSEPPADGEPSPAPAGGSDDDLLARAAEAQGMPEAMVKRSAAARAKAEGTTTEAVLAEWAGADPPADSGQSPEVPATPAPPADEPAAAAPEPTPQPAASADAGDLLAKAAAAQGLPEAMVKRSAAARAKAEGTTTEAVLAEWAGVEAPAPVAATAETQPEAPSVAPAEAPASPEPEADVEVIADEDVPVAKPTPEEPEPEPVGSAGALPRWLAALFVAVPLFALAYAGFLPNGPNCGDAGQLAVDPVTGVAVNCDGTEYGEGEADFFAIGAEVYGARCAACHGADGGGAASFPQFTEGALAATFPEGTCDDHEHWVTLGSSGWPDPTYGANDKPVGGLGVLMPAFGNQLTEEELASVVLYERVRFAGFDLEATKTDCGLGGEAVPPPSAMLEGSGG